jgi:uncharacterized protein YigA (DUF484 family)
MPRTAFDWTTNQLTEFMDGVSRADDEPSAIQLAVERAAEALDAEVAAAIVLTSVRAAVGFPRGEVPERELIAIAEGRQSEIEVPGGGLCGAIKVVLHGQPPGVLLVARNSDEPFARGEQALLVGMARVLSMMQHLLRVVDGERTLREKVERQARDNASLLASLQERQQLLDRLTEIERSISGKASLSEVFEQIVDGASRLLGDPLVALRLLDPEDPGYLVTVATGGLGPERREEIARLPVGALATDRALTGGRLVVLDDYSNNSEAAPGFVEEGLTVAMSAPVCDRREPVGLLTVASREPGRLYSRAEQDALAAFAEHAGLALTDWGKPEARLEVVKSVS